MTLSVCTLSVGRAQHIEKLVIGLRGSRRPPRQLIVAVVQGGRLRLPEASFPVVQVVLGGKSEAGGEGSLGRARNAAARLATGDLLVFLDGDCIPHPALLDDYAAAMTRRGGVFMGEVGYLPPSATDGGVDHARFEREAVRHPDRPEPPARGIKPAEGFRSFTALNFAIAADDFSATGGFDEGYCGPGAEDMDFARTLLERGLPLWWLAGATAWHQHHRQQIPPVDRLDSVLANAARFERKWGQAAMEHWLRAFELMGLIRREREGWVKLREPTEADLALASRPVAEPCASSAAMVRWLEERAIRRLDSQAASGTATAAA